VSTNYVTDCTSCAEDMRSNSFCTSLTGNFRTQQDEPTVWMLAVEWLVHLASFSMDLFPQKRSVRFPPFPPYDDTMQCRPWIQPKILILPMVRSVHVWHFPTVILSTRSSLIESGGLPSIWQQALYRERPDSRLILLLCYKLSCR